MGKKGKKEKKKGLGAEKTSAKTEKKVAQKLKKELQSRGEDDITKIIADIEEEEQKRKKVTEEVVPPPSPRTNFSLTPHPDLNEFILFGGEYFNGQQTFLYKDLYFYNIKRGNWTLVKSPGGPPPRSAHQAVAVSQGGGQLWIFGGEYANPTQTQFHHYKDFWVFHFSKKQWEKISSPGGPCARSGHRMVFSRKQLIVFGGFHETLHNYKYFNDVYSFDLETFMWKKLEPTGKPPTPRSACQMATLSDGRILVYGGYSKEKVKKDVDKGNTYSDMYFLIPDKNDSSGTKWKWMSLKQSSFRPSPRCGFSMTTAPGDRAFFFGGVFDEQDEEEQLTGVFYNDLFLLELQGGNWRSVTVSGKKDQRQKKKRRKKDKDKGYDEEVFMSESGEEDEETAEKMEAMNIDESTEVTAAPESTVTSSDGIFTVSIGPSLSQQAPQSAEQSVTAHSSLFTPSPRMNSGIVIKHGMLYLYGGVIEDGDRQITLSDLYALDIHKLDEWYVLISDDLCSQEWLESESSSEEEDEDEEEGAVGGDESEEEEEEEEVEEEMDIE